MGWIRPVWGKTPELARGVFVAQNAVIAGDVCIGEDSSVWYGAVLRGDVGFIRIGARTNVQDMVCMHMTEGVSNVEIAEEVTIGHGAIVHGARVGPRSLIGMGAIVLDGAEIGEEVLIAAGALVPPGMVVPAGSLVRGTPGRVARELSAAERAEARESAEHYVELAAAHRGATA